MAETEVVDQESVETATGDWRTSLPNELRENPSLARYKGVSDLASAYLSAEKLVGHEKIIVPGKDAKPEDYNALVFDRLGRPKAAEEYALPTVELPEDFPKPDEATLTSFKTEAHRLGLLPHQVAGLYQWQMQQQVGQFGQFRESQTKGYEATQKALRTEWGAAYPERVALAQKVLKLASGKDYDALAQSGFGNDPRVIRALANLGAKISEDQLGEGTPRGLTQTPSEAQSEINRVMGDQKNPYFEPNHPEHKAAVEKMQSLFRLVQGASA